MSAEVEYLESCSRLDRDQIKPIVIYYINSEETLQVLDRNLDHGGPGSEAIVLSIQDSIVDGLMKIRQAMHAYCDSTRIGRWVATVPSVGPVYGAGLVASVANTRVDNVSYLWQLCGLDPNARDISPKEALDIIERSIGKDKTSITIGEAYEIAALANRSIAPTIKSADHEKVPVSLVVTWLTKRPYSGFMDRVAKRIQENYTNPQLDDKYVGIYNTRLDYERRQNAAGAYEREALKQLNKGETRRATDYESYRAGRLPEGHLQQRAKRYAVKDFLLDFQLKSKE